MNLVEIECKYYFILGAYAVFLARNMAAFIPSVTQKKHLADGMKVNRVISGLV